MSNNSRETPEWQFQVLMSVFFKKSTESINNPGKKYVTDKGIILDKMSLMHEGQQTYQPQHNTFINN